MDLAGEQQRIERHPEIVDDDVVRDSDETGSRIDLDLGDVGTVRKGAVGAGECRARAQLRRIGARPPGQIGKTDRAIGAGDPHGAVADLQIANAGFQRLGGDLPQIGAKLVRRALDADPAGRNGSRPAGAKAGGDLIGVALENMNPLRRQSKLLGNDLGIGGLMALTARLGPDPVSYTHLTLPTIYSV